MFGLGEDVEDFDVAIVVTGDDDVALLELGTDEEDEAFVAAEESHGAVSSGNKKIKTKSVFLSAIKS